MAQTDCARCNGTGYASAARDSGTENAHWLHVQYGLYSCPSCGGSGKIGLSAEQEKAIGRAIVLAAAAMADKGEG